MKEVLRRRLLWSAATDSTFERRSASRGSVLLGRCIHCRRKLSLTVQGVPISRATLEHIIPRTHGGTNSRDNLAIACSACNSAKGHRLDCRRWNDPDLQSMVTRLRQCRKERLREPPKDWDLPPEPPEWAEPES